LNCHRVFVCFHVFLISNSFFGCLLFVFVVDVFVGHSLSPGATPLSSMIHLPPRATGRTYVCHPSTSSRRWMRRRLWITPVTSGSKTAWSIVLHLNSTRACALPRRLPSPRRNGHSFVWLRHQWRTASLVAVRASVSAWKPPRKKPSLNRGPHILVAVNGVRPFTTAHHQYVWATY
jgi:hypothetical protein